MQFFGSENEQLCVILQMEHNPAFVDMMSSLGKDNSTAGHNGRLLVFRPNRGTVPTIRHSEGN